jgi:hypothetical protein
MQVCSHVPCTSRFEKRLRITKYRQVQAWARLDDELEECMRDENGGVELVQLIDRDPELEERSRAGSETRGFPRPGTKRVNFRSGLFF